jgi:hypothetical protein
MANHQFACLASQIAKDRGFFAFWQLIPCRFGSLRQKSAIFIPGVRRISA